MDGGPEVRIGDRDRSATDDRLRAAHQDGMLTLEEYDERARACFAARFRRDLDVLVADLPAPDGAPAGDAVADRPVSAELAADREAPASWRDQAKTWGGNLVGLAVAGALAFAVLGADDGAAVFGGRTVTVAPGQTEVEVGVLFGSVRVVVPEGVRAQTSGVTIFGGTDCQAACAAPGAAGSPLDVSTRGAFGSVDVLTPAEAAARPAVDD